MSVIERWTVYEPGEGADPVVYRGRFKLMTPGGPDIGRAVVVVSEADYLGAVDLLREAEPFVVWPPGTPMNARERWAAAVASLTGGSRGQLQ